MLTEHVSQDVLAALASTVKRQHEELSQQEEQIRTLRTALEEERALNSEQRWHIKWLLGPDRDS